jgi:hypothetical protein
MGRKAKNIFLRGSARVDSLTNQGAALANHNAELRSRFALCYSLLEMGPRLYGIAKSYSVPDIIVFSPFPRQPANALRAH